MKTMFLLRPADARVMRYTGAWSEQGFLQGLAPARTGARLAATWFKLQGQLWCAVLAERNVFVGRVENGNITPVATYPTLVTSASWGNAINYAGKVRWLERNENGVLLYSFDGTSIVVLPVDLPRDEAGLPFDAMMSELTLALVGTRLAVLPRAAATFDSARPKLLARNVLCFLDVGTDVTVTTAASMLPVTLNTTLPKNEVDAATELSETIIGAGVYQDNVIALYADGWLGRVTADTRVKLGDVRTESFMRLGRYATTSDGVTARQVIVEARLLQGDALPYLLGCRIFISSGPYAGQSGTVVWIDGNNELRLKIASDTNSPFPAITANTEISFGRGVAGGFVGDVMLRSTPGPHIHTAFFEIGDALYGIVVGRQPDTVKVDNRVQPSFLVRVRGSATVFTPLQIGGKYLNAAAMSARFDQSDSSIHILIYDPSVTVQAVRHLRYSLSSGMINEVATAFASVTPSHLGAGNIIGYDTGELDISIGGIESDSVTGDVTVAYTIFGDTPLNHAVDFFYNIGTGWKKATVSGHAGASFTFVHALRADEPTFTGEIQYRAQVRRP